jgi:CRISPR/Cas system-associated exonuclease Cas4 (RecB family)
MTAVPASGIAEQYYCEQKVELEYIHGRVETESKREGQEFHEQLIKMRKAALKDIIEGIKHKKLFVASFPIVASFSLLVLVGIPDAVVFVRGVPALLIELKTTRGDTSCLWDDQLVQARTYGLILEEMGFDCSKLKLVIPRVRRTPQQLGRWKDVFLRSVILDVLKAEPAPQTLKKRESTIHVIKYSRAHAIADVKWAEAYWLSNRQPIPAGSAAKCRGCEFVEVCSYASAKRLRSSFSSKSPDSNLRM